MGRKETSIALHSLQHYAVMMPYFLWSANTRGQQAICPPPGGLQQQGWQLEHCWTSRAAK